MPDLPEFWIDVGGTFTDCLLKRPDHRLLTFKVLSSGVTKGKVTAFLDDSTIRDDARIGDPARFWEGYTLTLVDDAGAVQQSFQVTGFDAERGLFQ